MEGALEPELILALAERNGVELPLVGRGGAGGRAPIGALREALPDEARVGIVDKFQGQEGADRRLLDGHPPRDGPRGMEFLYNARRLNLATSPARCVAVAVATPVLLEPACTTVRQMWLANGYVRVGR